MCETVCDDISRTCVAYRKPAIILSGALCAIIFRSKNMCCKQPFQGQSKLSSDVISDVTRLIPDVPRLARCSCCDSLYKRLNSEQ